jgi:hypothetical protein
MSDEVDQTPNPYALLRSGLSRPTLRLQGLVLLAIASPRMVQMNRCCLFLGGGVTSIGELSAAYRIHAAYCTEIAARTADRENRLTLLNMACAWLLLTEQAEKK